MTLSTQTLTLDSLGQGTLGALSVYATLVGHVERQDRSDDLEGQQLAGQGIMFVTIPWISTVKLGDSLTITDSSLSPTTQVWSISSIEDDRQRHRWLRLKLTRDEAQL